MSIMFAEPEGQTRERHWTSYGRLPQEGGEKYYYASEEKKGRAQQVNGRTNSMPLGWN
jgi:hypothetical protein